MTEDYTDKYGNPLISFTGEVVEVGELLTFPSGFTKRETVVRTPDEKYPQELPLDAVNEQTLAQVKDLAPGDTVSVRASVRSNRGRTGKIFVNLTLQDIQAQARAQTTSGASVSIGRPPDPPQSPDDEDIPL